jgi:hypothetical protein
MTKQPASPLPIFRSAYGFSGRLLLVCLLLLFVLPPFVEHWGWDLVAKNVLLTVAMLAALLAVSDHRIGPGGVLFVAVPIAYGWLQHFGVATHGGFLIAYLCYLLVLVAFAVWRLLRFVLGAREVDAEVLAAGVSIYFLLGILWSYLYLLLGVFQADPFKGEVTGGGGRLGTFDSFYFSLCTLTTAGYGDISPVSQQARTLAVMESVTGVLYIAVLVARLVSLYSQAKPSADKA